MVLLWTVNEGRGRDGFCMFGFVCMGMGMSVFGVCKRKRVCVGGWSNCTPHVSRRCTTITYDYLPTYINDVPMYPSCKLDKTPFWIGIIKYVFETLGERTIGLYLLSLQYFQPNNNANSRLINVRLCLSSSFTGIWTHNLLILSLLT